MINIMKATDTEFDMVISSRLEMAYQKRHHSATIL